MEDTTNSDAQTDDGTNDDVVPSDSEETGSVTEDPSTDSTDDKSLRDTINSSLKKDFKSDKDIVKSMGEADKKISDQGSEIAGLNRQLEQYSKQPDKPAETASDKPVIPTTPDQSSEVAVLTDRLNQSEFYKANPSYDKSEIREVLGRNPAETIKNESIKSVVDGKVESDKIEESKSVLHSNPRLGSATDKVTQAKDSNLAASKALREGDVAGMVAHQADASNSATEAVIDAYELTDSE